MSFYALFQGLVTDHNQGQHKTCTGHIGCNGRIVNHAPAPYSR